VHHQAELWVAHNSGMCLPHADPDTPDHMAIHPQERM
jgi:hypothetical protein